MNDNIEFAQSNAEYPIILVPKNCAIPLLGYDANAVRLYSLTISSTDVEGVRVDYYSGTCILKFLDRSYDEHIRELRSQVTESKEELSRSRSIEEYVSGNTIYDEIPIWTREDQSPGPSAHDSGSLKTSLLTEASECTLMATHDDMFISDNICDYEEVIGGSDDPKSQSQTYEQQIIHNNGIDLNNLEFNEDMACAELLGDLPEQIIVEEFNNKHDQSIMVSEKSQSNALTQLMSVKNKSQRQVENTIMFLSEESQPGLTIHRIAHQDPSLRCKEKDVNAEIYLDGDDDKPNRKKYLCANCKQIFNDMPSFRDHIDRSSVGENSEKIEYFCPICQKTLKSQKKIDSHVRGHGDPDLECGICKKVYSSKFVLRSHYKKNHPVECPCQYCGKVFDSPDKLQKHEEAIHFLLLDCDKCNYSAYSRENLRNHYKIHDNEPTNTKKTDSQEDSNTFIENSNTQSEIIENDSGSDSDDYYLSKLNKNNPVMGETEVEKADIVIAKVLSSKTFLCSCKYKGLKVCVVCSKSFDRLSELKRHLIEHVIKCSLAKTPVNSASTLDIRCVVCQTACFSSVTRYKDHLRKHAKLTIYQCTVCDKSFSDSSNFCKHKKVHKSNFLMCDLCQRKFNSKKMLAKHMELHNKTKPKLCTYCDKSFHFQSTLNKHVKSIHNKELIRFHCRFCEFSFKSLKEKWDHEWVKHQVRKIVVDCLICGRKFRKFTELKRHSSEVHGLTDLSNSKAIMMKKLQSNPENL